MKKIKTRTKKNTKTKTKIKIRIKLFIALIFYTNLSYAQFNIKCIGLSDCLPFYNSSIDEKVIYMSWASGFISSQNILNRSDYIKDISYDRSIIWLEYYCYNHPKKKFKDAVVSFIDKFSN